MTVYQMFTARGETGGAGVLNRKHKAPLALKILYSSLSSDDLEMVICISVRQDLDK